MCWGNFTGFPFRTPPETLICELLRLCILEISSDVSFSKCFWRFLLECLVRVTHTLSFRNPWWVVLQIFIFLATFHLGIVAGILSVDYFRNAIWGFVEESWNSPRNMEITSGISSGDSTTKAFCGFLHIPVKIPPRNISRNFFRISFEASFKKLLLPTCLREFILGIIPGIRSWDFSSNS